MEELLNIATWQVANCACPNRCITDSEERKLGDLGKTPQSGAKGREMVLLCRFPGSAHSFSLLMYFWGKLDFIMSMGFTTCGGNFDVNIGIAACEKFKHSVRTSQETHSISITTTNRLMLFRETVAVYCENHTEHTNTLCGQNTKQFSPYLTGNTLRLHNKDQPVNAV
jgi:hypothetical protein